MSLPTVTASRIYKAQYNGRQGADITKRWSPISEKLDCFKLNFFQRSSFFDNQIWSLQLNIVEGKDVNGEETFLTFEKLSHVGLSKVRTGANPIQMNLIFKMD